MANVTALMVKELREKTGAGMMDCKKALVESDGDMQAAIDFLRKKGLSAAAKKAGRITSEGAVASYISDDGKTGVIVEVNCETDFVARNPDFQAFVENLRMHIAAKAPKVIKAEEGADALYDQKWIADENLSVNDVVNNLVANIGENISPRRFVRWELDGEGLFNSYIHMGGKLGVLVELGCSADAAQLEPVQNFAKMLSMHATASNPICVTREEVPEDLLAREREIYKTQVIESGKPAELADRIVDGKMNKYFKDNVLLEQIWVHDTSLTVSKALAAVGKEIGKELSIRRFTRWQVGEGLEKRSNDLAAEVAAQLDGK